MTALTWQTPAGFLGTLTERRLTATNFVAVGTSSVSYSVISGSIPSGLHLNTSTGVMIGTPVSVPNIISSKFVIRARAGTSIADRTFSVDVSGPSEPLWVTPAGGLPVGLNGEYYTINKEYVDYSLRAETDILRTGNTLKYFIADNDGQLPPGLTLSQDGRITGFVDDSLHIDVAASIEGGYDDDAYDRYPYEYGVITNTTTDTVSYVKKYSIKLVTNESTCRVMIDEGYDMKSGNPIYIDGVQVLVAGQPLPISSSLNNRTYYIKAINNTTIGLYQDRNLLIPVSSTSTAFGSYVSGGTVYWGSSTGVKPQVINKIYQFYVNVTDGIVNTRRLFNIEVIDHNSLRVDTTYLSIDSDLIDTSAGYLLAPIWQSKYGAKLPRVSNLGTVRAGRNQVISVYEYDPYPLEGAIVFDWSTVTVNPDIKLTTDSVINAASLPTKNLQGQNTVYFKNAELFPVKGMKIQFSEYIPNTNNTIYTVTGVIKLTETSGILNIDQPLDRQLPDSRIFYVGTKSQHPPGLSLDPGNGTLYGQLAYEPSYGFGYRFTVKVVKIDQKTGTSTLYNAVGSNNAKIVGKIYTTLDAEPPVGSGTGLPIPASYTGDVGDIILVGKAPLPISRTDVVYDKLLPLMDGTIRAYVYSKGVSQDQAASWVYLGETAVSNQIYILTILGDVRSSIQWISTSSLGTLTPGEISEIAVKAVNSNTNYSLEYEIISGQLPTGLTLNGDGTIQGKVSNTGQTYFDFSSSTGIISFDGGATTIDKNWYVTIRASDVYRLSAVDKQFAITVYQDTLTDFTRIYVKPLLSVENRASYKEFVTDPIIFDPVLLYRPNDPEFGVQPQIRMIIESGIEQASLDQYASAMSEYFYRKQFLFGEVKSIKAQDSNGNNVYEIVYVEIIDNQMNGTTSPSYAVSVGNMQLALQSIDLGNSTVIAINERLQPKYMTTLQADTGVAIGFVKAMPICYTIPGGSTKIISRIKNALDTGVFDFKQYHFDTDRIVIETVKDTGQTGWLLNPTERR